jgi:hypothetical protein
MFIRLLKFRKCGILLSSTTSSSLSTYTYVTVTYIPIFQPAGKEYLRYGTGQNRISVHLKPNYSWPMSYSAKIPYNMSKRRKMTVDLIWQFNFTSKKHSPVPIENQSLTFVMQIFCLEPLSGSVTKAILSFLLISLLYSKSMQKTYILINDN